MINVDLFLIIAEIILACGLWILSDISIKYENSNWRLFYLLPGIICLIVLWMEAFEISMLPAYLSALFMAVGFFRQEKQIRKYTCAIGCALTIAGAIICAGNPGYRTPDFVKAFDEGFSCMKDHYCLTEQKGIDWDALYQKYLPKFQLAKTHHDKVENVLVWQQFTEEFHDGHVNFQPYEEETYEDALIRAFGNDYGLSLLCLSDGRVVAVNVEAGSEAQKSGITNGCEITGWNNQAPDALTKDVTFQLFHSPDIENEEFYKILYVAGIGGDSIAVDFIDTKGEKRQAILPAIGNYKDRLQDTLDILDQGMNIGTLTWSELSDDAVLFRVKNMSYDTLSYQNGDFSGLKQEMEEKLVQYREEGKNLLVLDLRSNGGGNPYMILAMAELLGSEGEHFYMKNAVLDEKTCEFMKNPDTGKYLTDSAITFCGKNLWGHGKIILLVNGQCVSAGDHFTQIMGGMDNVTIMGLTKSNSSGQAIRYVKTQSGILIFSAVPTLDENGEIFIDTGTDRISKIPFDIKIPLDENAVHMLFDEREDYVLWYALHH